jgi:hypothetical protein
MRRVILDVSSVVSRSVKVNEEKIVAIMRALVVMDSLTRKRGEYRLGEVTQWSHMSRATCDRYLRRMVEWEMLEQKESEYAGKKCRVFSIAKDGEDFIGAWSV